MSEYFNRFFDHLKLLSNENRRAMAVLRKSLSFAPGVYRPAFAYVEPFVSISMKDSAPFRLALYLIAGLYALHPQNSSRSLAAGMRLLASKNKAKKEGIEKRFLALLEADPEIICDYLRQVIRIVAVENIGLNYAALFNDLVSWLNPYGVDAAEKRDQIRQKWARDFYGALATKEAKTAIAVNAATN
jgi:CRISPR system Cascade subunit CasB